MSPNGRRAWREWVRRQDLRRKHKQPKGSVCRMARQARRHIPLVPGVVLPKFITARSLVGMSQSARKRAARIACVGHRFRSRRLKLVWFTGWARDICGRIATESDKATITRYQEARAKYRIGERLRPCPGCCACKSHMLKMRELRRAYPATAKQHPQHLRRIIERQSWRCGVRIMNADDSEHLHRTDVHCDGSGVLPARKLK